MGLTRSQWEEMWAEIKSIERIVAPTQISKHAPVMKKIQAIKDKIQLVIGQME